MPGPRPVPPPNLEAEDSEAEGEGTVPAERGAQQAEAARDVLTPADADTATRTPTTRQPRRRPRLPEGLAYCAAVYLATRIPIIVALVLYRRTHPAQTLSRIALRRDGGWYLRLATEGYSHSLRTPVDTVTDAAHDFSEWAFFPGYPLLIRLTHAATGLSSLVAMLAVASVAGLLAVWAMYALGNAFGGVRVARGSALLIAAWPGSAAFTFPYSDGLYIASTAASLACLMRRRWVAAGLLGAVATATRPTGLALVAAAGVVAVVRLVRDRDWRPLTTPILASAGAGGFAAYAWVRTGDVMTWRHAENLWGQQLDFSTTLVRSIWTALANYQTTLASGPGPIRLAGNALEVFGFLGLIVMAVALWRQRRAPSTALVIYFLAATLMIVGYSAVAPRPRTVMAVLPGFVWLAASLPRWAVLALASCLTVGVGVVAWLWMWAVIP